MKKPSNPVFVFSIVIGVMVWLMVSLAADPVVISDAIQSADERATSKTVLEVLAPTCLTKFDQVTYQIGAFKIQNENYAWVRDKVNRNPYFKGRTQRIKFLCAILLSAL